MAMTRFMHTQGYRLRRCRESSAPRHFPPQLVVAAPFLRRWYDRLWARNTPVTPFCHARTCSTLSALHAPAARRREWLRNWLALLALLAIGIV
jgi:hypothetical protein